VEREHQQEQRRCLHIKNKLVAAFNEHFYLLPTQEFPETTIRLLGIHIRGGPRSIVRARVFSGLRP
jgi:hypothetical protein